MRRLVPACVRRAWLLALVAGGLPAGCRAPADGGDASEPAAIYGRDDRVEAYALPADGALAAVAKATAVVVSADMVAGGGGGDGVARLLGPTYGEANGLCADEPFAAQPSVGTCSAFLVGRDLVATAGHCVSTASACARTRLVFDYAMPQDGGDPRLVPAASVYGCAEVVERAYDAAGEIDRAVLRLDRPVLDREPLALLRAGMPALGTAVAVVGHPRGLPLKVAAGASVLRATERAFVSDVDAFVGNSGSPVVDAGSGMVLGVLARGGRDFDYGEGCGRHHVCTPETCPGETATAASALAAEVPELGPHLRVDAAVAEEAGPTSQSSSSQSSSSQGSSWRPAEPGDQLRLRLDVSSDGTRPVPAVDAHVTSLTPSINASRADAAPLAAPLPFGAHTELVFTGLAAAADAPCGAPLPLLLHYDGRTTPFSIQLGRPVLQEHAAPGGAAIPDSDHAGVELRIDVPDLAPYTDLTGVRVEVEHPQPADLYVMISAPPAAPDAPRVWVTLRVAGDPAPVHGVFGPGIRPFQPLSTLRGALRAGEWRLKIKDVRAGGEGRVLRAGLLLTHHVCNGRL